MLNKTRITVLAWLRAVKLSPSSGGGWMARTVWNGVLISGAGIWAEHWRQCPLPGAIKTLEWSSVLMSPEWLYLSLPHFLSHPEGEKLEAQVLKGCKVWSWPEVRPLWPGASCSLNSQGFPHPVRAGNVKPHGQILKPHWALYSFSRHRWIFILVNLKCQFAG